MPLLTRSQLSKPQFQTHQIPMDKVGYPEGSYLLARPLSAKELIALRQQQGASPELGNLAFTYSLLATTLVDEEGHTLYENARDAQDFLDVSVPPLEYISLEVLKLSGIEASEKN